MEDPLDQYSSQQALMQLNKQLLKQKQDERLSHETMLTFCATAELVATGKLGKYAEYYEHKFNNKKLFIMSIKLLARKVDIRSIDSLLVKVCKRSSP